ncbi:MAG: hypothetical protein AB1540_14545 [Bdellovibrionota bacterium]
MVRSIGYAADKENMQDQICTIKEITSGEVRTDCDLLSGASGSPLLFSMGGEYRIVALNSGASKLTTDNLKKDQYYELSKYVHSHASVAVRPDSFIDVLRDAQEDYRKKYAQTESDAGITAVHDAGIQEASQIECDDVAVKTGTISSIPAGNPSHLSRTPTTAGSLSEGKTATVSFTKSSSVGVDGKTLTSTPSFVKTSTAH